MPLSERSTFFLVRILHLDNDGVFFSFKKLPFYKFQELKGDLDSLKDMLSQHEQGMPQV